MKYSQKQPHTKNMLQSSCRSSHTLLKNMKYSQKQSHTQICSKASAQISMVAALNIHTLREGFHNFSMVMKTSIMDIKPKTLHVSWSMLLFHWPVQASYHRLCSGLSYAYCYLYTVSPSNRQVL